jgi:hypothetical protein
MAFVSGFKTRWFVLLPLVLLGSAQARTETLKETLAAKHLPVEAAKLANLEKSITSWAELDDANQYVIAYYLDDGSGMLNSKLFLDRYDRKSGEWKSGQLPEGPVKVGENADETDVCLGSVLSVTASGGRLFLETHINPSAECVLIVSDALKLQESLYGWLVAHLGEDILIYQRSEVHFAPVHPAEIALYDLRTKRDVTIFPPKPEPAIRRARTAQLQNFYKENQEWCNKNDDPCDPESFDSELGEKVVTNEAEAAVAFLISYEQIQLVQGDVQKPSGPKDVLYIYRGVNDEAKMEYRELLLEHAKAHFGTDSLQNLLQPEILKKIFAEAPAK